jgi:hypothetical protein
VNDNDAIDGGDTTHAVTIATGAVSIANNDDVICRYTNTRQQGKIQLVKDFVGTSESVTIKIGTAQDGYQVETKTISADGSTN